MKQIKKVKEKKMQGGKNKYKQEERDKGKKIEGTCRDKGKNRIRRGIEGGMIEKRRGKTEKEKRDKERREG